MGKINAAIQKFNSGIISQLGLARTDVKHVSFSAETQTNWVSRLLGSMMLRPGTKYIDTISTGANPARHVPFIYANNDTAIIEMTANNMRVRISEQAITRLSVSTAIANGTFTTNLTSWTNADQAGCTSAWATGSYMSLIGTNFSNAVRYQQVTVAAGDQNKEHGIHITVSRGYVDVLIGTGIGGSSYVLAKGLGEGVYSYAITPTGNFYIQLQSATQYASLIKSVAVEAAGSMNIATPYSGSDLQNLRWDQSADVIFVACSGQQQNKISRVGGAANPRSWALQKYYADDGPFELENTDQSVQFTPSATTGDITLTSSSAFFTSNHIGSLFRIASQGQFVTVTLSGANQFSNPIEVTGIGAQRAFLINITGVWVANITLQQSIGSPGAWVDVATYTTNQTNLSYNDGDDNSIIYYRIGIKAGDYTSGTATATETFAGGSINGICRITAYTSATSVSAIVLKPLGGVTASYNWWQGTWSPAKGWPTAVQLYQGRLWQAGNDSVDASVSDAYSSYDDSVVGDSGPISSTIGSGPVETINWIMGGLLLLMGGQGGEHSLSAGVLGTPITPTTFVLRNPSNFGSSNVQMQKVDWNAVFVKKDGVRVCSSVIENAVFAFDYKTTDLTLFVPEIGIPGITQLAVQRIPDTRIHAVRGDGKAALNVWDPAEDEKAWMVIDLGTNAWVEDAFVMPSLSTATIDPNGLYNDANGNSSLVPEDMVYYVVRRVINGVTVRYLERWSWEYECQGGTLSKQADCHSVIHNVSPSTAISVPQLAGQSCVVWADGIYQGTFTADGSGNITLTTAVTNAVVGLGYTAQYKSSKLAYATQGTPLNQKKIIESLGLVLFNTHCQGLQYGKNFSSMQDLPSVVNGAPVAANTIFAQYDHEMFSFPGDWDTDSRLCLQAQAPLPCTLLAAVVGVKANED